MTADDPRARLAALVGASESSLTGLSMHLLRRNPGYLQQYVSQGVPRRLAEQDRRRLADFFGVPETELGAEPRADAAVRLPRLDVAASAGAGANVDAEVELGAAYLPVELAKQLRLTQGSVIRVRGDSMEPGLVDGDQIVVDAADRAPGPAGGVFVIRVDGVVMVKRLARRSGRLVATSDNPSAPPVPDAQIEVIGRVVWQMRAPR